MAKRIVELFTDDLDGTESEDVKTVKFGWDGKNYEIDLTGKNEAAFAKAMAKYLDKARPVTVSNGDSGRRKYGTGPARRDTKHIREWLRGQNIEISDRGRIPTDLMEKYNAAH